MALSKIRAGKDTFYICSTFVRDVSIFRESKMSIPMVYCRSVCGTVNLVSPGDSRKPN